MNAIIDNLKNKEILYEDSIELLKNYIASRFPDESESYRARVFADAVHKILDEHVSEFRRQQQKDIKRSILTEAVTNNSFEINAYDILRTCVELDIDEAVYADDLVSWLNHQQAIPVQSDMIHEISETVRVEVQASMGSPIGQDNSEVEEEALIDAYDSIPEQPVEVEEAFGYFADEASDADVNYANMEEAQKESTYKEQLQDSATEVSQDMDAFEADLMAQLEAAFAEVDEVETVQSHASEPYYSTVLGGFEDGADDTVKEEEEVLLPSEPAFGNLEDVFAATLNAASKKDQPLNMYNMADTIYEELAEDIEEAFDEADDIVIKDEDRPVIKIERERQVDAIQDLPELPEEPVVQETFRETLNRWIQSGQYKKDLLRIVPFAAGFIILVTILYFVLTGVFSTGELIPEQDMTESTTGLIREVVPELQKAPKPEQTVEILLKRDKRMDGSSLHESIRHKAIDEEALKAWLVRRNSLLAEDMYFDIVIAVAEEYDLNPLLLFAITGQEQDFVQKDHEEAAVIINNPFNVYGSWKNFNTTLEESAQIASKTVHTLSAHRPDEMDPIQWINNNEVLGRRYAEDDRWHEGVSLILKNLEVVAGRP